MMVLVLLTLTQLKFSVKKDNVTLLGININSRL